MNIKYNNKNFFISISNISYSSFKLFSYFILYKMRKFNQNFGAVNDDIIDNDLRRILLKLTLINTKL